jgi:hypothetical protein
MALVALLKIKNESFSWIRHEKKISKLSFDLKWREMESKINFGHPKWMPK